VHGLANDSATELAEHQLPLVSLSVADKDPETVGMFLDADWNIAVRTGLQCAPLAHEALGTAPLGTVRFGFGPFNTEWQVDRAITALRAIAG
jgi:cysteine desulfurase/selenocysteine lyase